MKYTLANLTSFSLKAIKCTNAVSLQIVDSAEDYVEIFCSDKDFKKLIIDQTQDSFVLEAHVFAILSELSIIVHAKGIEKLNVAGSVRVVCNKTSQNCHTRLSGSIKAEFNLSPTQRQCFCISGMAAIEFNGDVQTLEFSSAGSAKGEFFGQCDDANFKTSGSSKISAQDFICQNICLSTSGASKYIVHATKTLAIQMSGAGKLSFCGNPEVTECKASGATSIKKL